MTVLPRDMPAEIRKMFDYHGHGFQFSVMQLAEKLFKEKRATWRLLGAEIPVELQGKPTHIDFVYEQEHGRVVTYLVGECKRVNPARGIWAFMKAPYTWFQAGRSEVAFDELRAFERSYGINRAAHFGTTSRPICRIGMEMRGDEKGPSSGGNSPAGGAIDEAITQVLRGSGGLLERARGDPDRFSDREVTTRFVPVVFTTAELWVSDINLADSDLATGKLAAGAAERSTWLWFVHNRTRELVPMTPATRATPDLGRILRDNDARAVAIVSHDGIEEFLSTMVVNLVGG